MRKSPVLTVVFILLFPVICSAFDWKALHEKADSVSLEEARAAEKAHPDSAENAYVSALSCLMEHQDQEALILFKRIQNLDPTVFAADWGIAEVSRRQHGLEHNGQILQDLISRHPDFAPAYISLAYVKYIQMDFNKAVELAQKVIDMGRGKVDVSNLVRAYLLLGGCKGMIAHYGGPLSKVINGTGVLPALRKAEALQPDNAGVLFGIGSYYLLAPGFAGGDRNAALDHLEKAVKADPLMADTYVRLAQAYKLKGDNEKYNACLQKALEIDPQNELALDIRNKTCKFICVGR